MNDAANGSCRIVNTSGDVIMLIPKPSLMSLTSLRIGLTYQ